MSAIRINAAAAMLGVSASTLRAWERRYGFPRPRRSEGNHRQFDLAEIEALRAAIVETGEISSAVTIAQSRGSGLPGQARLGHAFRGFDAAAADALLEESLAVRSLERTIESVLIAAVAELAESCAGSLSPELCFGWRYATAWMCAQQRLAAPASLPHGVLLFDATGPLELDALRLQALELFLRRGGLRVLSLPTEIPPERLGNALRALAPEAIVLAGSHAGLDEIARLVYSARRIAAEALVLDFGGALPDTGASTIERLGDSPAAASAAICAELSRQRPALPGGQRRFIRADDRAPQRKQRRGRALPSG